MFSPSGVVTSIKSIDLNAATYQNDTTLMNRVSDYVGRISGFDGDRLGEDIVTRDEIKARVLQLVIPKGSMTKAQQIVIQAVRDWAGKLNKPVDLIITEF
jgi:hypothetical protein